MKVKVSTRMLMDLLACRVTPEQFRLYMGETRGQKNLFQHWLENGMTIKSAEFESAGLDADDDMLVLTLADDPAARPLRIEASET